ncbi:MAG: hypothetical protein RMN24_10845, partial [Anaerolineae bacterium]|nr:hypothetical protein [Anaerolineae bacterium]
MYSPRLTAVGTLSPAAAQSVSTNSPARRGAIRLVRGCFENFFQQNIYNYRIKQEYKIRKNCKMAEIQQICYYSIDLTNTKWTNLV